MSSTIIVDYGMGNLRSVQKAFEHIGEPAQISSCARTIACASRLVLPGVGAFRDAAAALKRHDLIPVLRDYVLADRPFLGICLGLQLLMEMSFEDGQHEGLGIIPGVVRKFELPPEYKIPHMGWNQAAVSGQAGASVRHMLKEHAWFYFVHSYYDAPVDTAVIAAQSDYGGRFTCAVARDNIFATQFHPEKSAAAGLKIYENFTRWNP